MQAALACAPVASLLVTAGASASGLALHRADLAAAGAGVAALGLVGERMQSRAARRHLRQDRARMRGQLHEVQNEIARLRRELATQPAVLLPQPPPTSPGTGPRPVVVDAFDRASSPPTPRSLPILTANRRGLQSCAPGLVGPSVPAISWPLQVPPPQVQMPQQPMPQVPAAQPVAQLPVQRPPATPITGLHLPPVADPSLPELEPGPAVPVLSAGVVPQLPPGPCEPVTGPVELPRPPHQDHSLFTPAGSGRSGDRRADVIDVIDVRTVPARESASSAGLSAESIDALVYSSLVHAERDGLTLTLEGPPRVPGSLFEPVVPVRSAHPADTSRAGRIAQGTAAAVQTFRGGAAELPPSPFFTPGAFERESA
jgi:hypothetical protein